MRYLTDQPVEAVPPSAWYRFTKLARRNRLTLTIGALVAVTLAVLVGGLGSVMGVWAGLRAAGSEALAEADRWEAAGRWPEELQAVKRAEALLASGHAGAARLASIRRRKADLEMVLRLEEIRLEIAASVNVKRSRLRPRSGRRALRSGVSRLRDGRRPARSPGDGPAPARGSRRGSSLWPALDHWSYVRNQSRNGEGTDWKRLLAAARAVDPDPCARPVPVGPDRPGQEANARAAGCRAAQRAAPVPGHPS